MRNTPQEALGKWPGILEQLGFDETTLSGRHVPCPICGGKDRFRFDDKEGRGTYFCSQCGPGDGIKLVMEVRCLTAGQAMALVDTQTGRAAISHVADKRTEADKVRSLRSVWAGAKRVEHDDAVSMYLASRLGARYDSTNVGDIRCHPSLAYKHDGGLVTTHPAMVALVRNADGSGQAIHRTYLSAAGAKANVPTPKKIIAARTITGCAIRLSPVGEDGVLAVSEGIETALAVEQAFGFPTWACVSAQGLESFVAPAGVTKLLIYGDHDANGHGQHAAYGLMRRAHAKGLEVSVHLPKRVGSDWLDETMGEINGQE